MKHYLQSSFACLASALLLTACQQTGEVCQSVQQPVDCVNPYMGNISHLLVPTYPTVHLPNSMLRVYPERADFTGDRLGGLPLMMRNRSNPIVIRSIWTNNRWQLIMRLRIRVPSMRWISSSREQPIWSSTAGMEL